MLPATVYYKIYMNEFAVAWRAMTLRIGHS